MPNKISVVFHRGSNFDYHFIIKELANEFERQFEGITKNKEKCKKFLKIDKDGNETIETISYTTKFIDSARFMASSSSNFVDNLTERIHKIKCNGCGCFLEYKRVKGNLTIYKFSSKKFNEKLKKKFKNTFKFFNNNINKFVFLLRKGVYISL